VDQAKKIVILGGGSAGWMTASMMAKHWADKGVDITLIESPDIGVIGVGEGSTPMLKTFFQFLGIEEQEWMPECNATYKNGIRFEGWCTKPGFENYFHPFVSELDGYTLQLFERNALLRRCGVNVEVQPDKFFLTSILAEKRLAPIPHHNFPFDVSYGYHFDSILLGKFLKNRMIGKGVKHIEAKIVGVKQHHNGDIASLTTETDDTIEADFFVDCTGFIGYLIQKTLGVPFVSFSDNLFNDSAVAIPSSIDNDMPSETVSTAMRNGWAWKIPLQSRYGNGYVYSSNYCSGDEAETELRELMGALDADVEARHIKMKVGRLKSNWSNNCVAIGLSQGFIEPLEATALQFIQTSIQGFMDAWETGSFTNQHRDNYNANIVRNFEGIRDYIVLHYITNSRTDTQYWKDNHGNRNTSDSLGAMIKCWMEGGDIAAEIESQGIARYYKSISWHSIFAGMGIFPEPERLRAGTVADNQVDFEKLEDFLTRSALNFDPQSQFLANQNQA
jgi:2-polyprenyl-6-methoxyphenol hydroxylase-like FAD-dependent oxidoreductase